jgi:hypothetical protein
MLLAAKLLIRTINLVDKWPLLVNSPSAMDLPFVFTPRKTQITFAT